MLDARIGTVDGPDSGPSHPTIRMWLGRQSQSEELKQQHWPNWRAYWRWYRNYVQPLNDPADWWRSNEVIPTPFKIIETVLPRYLLGMFENPDWFSMEARNARSEQYETLCYNLLRTVVEDMRPFTKVYDAIKYATITGHAWGKVIWREEYETRRTLIPKVETLEDEMTGESREQTSVDEQLIEEATFDGPDFEWRSLDRIWPDPSGEMRWIIEEIDTTLAHLLDTQDQLEIYNKSELARLESSVQTYSLPDTGDAMGEARRGTSMGMMATHDREPESTEGIPNYLVSPSRDGIGVKLLQCWGWVDKPYRGKDDIAWRLCVIANGQFVLRNVPSPTPDLKPPYFPIKSVRIPGRLYGESVLRYVGPLSDQQSRLANMRLDEVFLGVWQQYLIRKGALASDNQALFQPGGYLELNLDPNQSLNDIVQVMPRRPILPDAYNEDMYRQTQAEHAAAASDIMQGVGGSDRQTATEVERKLQQGNARHVLQVMLFDYEFKKEILERTWKWLQMRLTRQKQVRMGEEYANIDLRDIQIPIDIVVGGGLFALSKQTRLAMDQELVQLLQVPAFQQLVSLNPKYAANIFRQLLMDRGWKNPDRFVPGEKELQELVAQSKAEALVGQIMSEGGGTGAEGMGMAGQMEGMPDMSNPGQDNGLVGQPLSDYGMASNPLLGG